MITYIHVSCRLYPRMSIVIILNLYVYVILSLNYVVCVFVLLFVLLAYDIGVSVGFSFNIVHKPLNEKMIGHESQGIMKLVRETCHLHIWCD